MSTQAKSFSSEACTEVVDTLTKSSKREMPFDIIETMKLEIPMCVMGSYDPLTHLTQKDISWLVRHELDLYEEGEDTDIKNPRQAQAARRFLERYPIPL